MATETKVEEQKPETVKAVDQMAVKLANLEEEALKRSAQAESKIVASQSFKTYSDAGNAHLESIKCGKASLDYESERDGVASKWMPSSYDDVIDSITRRVRATNPEVFADFEALKEKSAAPSKNRERIHNRVLVGMVAEALVPLLGDRTWEIPYRLVANYLVADRVFKFSKAEVVGELRQDNVEFLKTQLGLLVDKKSNTASFLNALRGHFDQVDQAASDAANAHLTPEERKRKASAASAGKTAAKKVQSESAVKTKLTQYVNTALSGQVSPEEVAKIIRTAAKTAKVTLPLGKMNPETITPAELSSFLQQVITKGGRSIDERKKLRLVIARHGSELADKARNKAKEKAVHNGKPALAATA
jgi:hypothetical protein